MIHRWTLSSLLLVRSCIGKLLNIAKHSHFQVLINTWESTATAHTAVATGSFQRESLPVIPSTCFFLPIIIYPGASLLIHILVSLEFFAFEKFSQICSTDATVDSFTSTRNVLCYNFWAFVDELELREKLESHQPPSRDFKQEFIDKLIVQWFHPPQSLGEYHLIPVTDSGNCVYLHHHLIIRHCSLRQMKAQRKLRSFFCWEFSCPKHSF